MNDETRILIVEDQPADAELAQREIRKSIPDCVFQRVETHEDFLRALETFQPDAILSDYHLPRFDGLTALKLAKERAPLTPLILWTGSLSEDIAVECMRAGANNYVIKDNIKRLGTAVVHALEEGKVLLEHQRAEESSRQSKARAERSERTLLALIHAAQSVQEALTPTDVYHAIGAEAAKLGYRIIIYHLDDAQSSVDIIYHSYAPNLARAIEKLLGVEFSSYKFPIHEGDLFSQAIAKNQTFLIDNLEELEVTAASILPAALRPLARQLISMSGLEKSITAPLNKHGKVIGLLDFVGDDLQEADIPAVAAFANQAAVALERARLYEEAKQEIARRQRAEESLRASEKRFSTLFEKAAYAIALSRMPDGVIVDVNETFERVFGYTKQEAVGKTSLEVSLQPDAEIRTRYLSRLKEDGSAYIPEMPLRTKSGEMRIFSAHIDLVNIGGENYILNSTEDITARKQAEEDQRSHLRELEALNIVSTALRVAQTVEQALPILLDQTLIALGCEDGEISLYDPSSGGLRVAQARGWFGGLQAPPIKPGEGITGTVFASGQARHTVEFARDPLLHPALAEQIPPGWGGACVPIHSAENTVGVLFVSTRLPNQISPEAMNLLGALAEMTGAAIHRLHLHEQTTRRLAQLQALQTIDQAITTSLDKRATLNVLLEQVIAQLNVDAAGVLLLNPHSLNLEYAAGRGFRSRIYEESRVRMGEGIAGRAALERQIINIHHLSEAENFARAQLVTVEGFVCYHAAPLVAKGQALGLLEIFLRADHPDFNQEWQAFFAALTEQAAIAIDNARLFENLQRSNLELLLAYDETIEGWSRALDLRDKETEGHTQRVTELTMNLSRALGIGDAELVQIHRGALLHDIGKMGVPDGILLKPGKLTDEEWELMRQHPTFAYQLLLPISFLRLALDIPYCHHEKWDGSGYPRGLKGEEIPLAARLFAIVDVWDALTNDRPYRAAWSKEKTLEHILALSGTHFEPRVVELFLNMMNENK